MVHLKMSEKFYSKMSAKIYADIFEKNLGHFQMYPYRGSLQVEFMQKGNLETADFEFRNNFERIQFPHFL